MCAHRGLIICFKYADFLIENVNAVGGHIPLIKLALPVGISFYTFQILSYLVDVYRKNCQVQKNLISFGAYVSMFPQLIAGPIVRYSDIEKQLVYRTHTVDQAALGIRRFMLGMGKKVLLANSLGKLCDIFQMTSDPSVLYYWLYAIAFCLQIYFNFPDTVIWQSDWEKFSVFIFRRISIILMSQKVFRNSGDGGI